MDIQTLIPRLKQLDSRTLVALLAAPTISYYAFQNIYNLLHPTLPIFCAPRPPQFSSPQPQESPSALPYPPTALPGARDVPTPHGLTRCYEFGPLTGRKVLLIHGISTPCIALAPLAKNLVEEYGCRVCLFDLYGRGYSDSPDPRRVEQGSGLWVEQIFSVLGSSELNWLGGKGEGGGVTVVGYSLGGGIAADFTRFFPRLVGGLVLIAPSGLLRPKRLHWSSRVVYGGWLPRWVVEWVVGRRLGGSSKPGGKVGGGNPEKTTPAGASGAEVPGEEGHPALAPDSKANLFADRPGVSVADAVAWQVREHPGFIPAFISSIQHSPISGQCDAWRTIGERLSAQKGAPEDLEKGREGLREGEVLMLLGREDGVIVAEETAEDAREALAEGNVRVEVLEGGHDVVIVNAQGCARVIGDFWAEKGGRCLPEG